MDNQHCENKKHNIVKRDRRKIKGGERERERNCWLLPLLIQRKLTTSKGDDILNKLWTGQR